MNQNDNDIALLDALCADRLAACLDGASGRDTFKSLLPDDILAVPGVTSLIGPRALARLGASVSAIASVTGDDDADVEMELRRDQAADTVGKVVGLISAQARAISPGGGSVTVLRHADRRLEEALQQLIVDLVSLGAAALKGACPELQAPAQ